MEGVLPIRYILQSKCNIGCMQHDCKTLQSLGTGWMDGWMGGWMVGWMGGWLDGWVGGWMDG